MRSHEANTGHARKETTKPILASSPFGKVPVVPVAARSATESAPAGPAPFVTLGTGIPIRQRAGRGHPPAR